MRLSSPATQHEDLPEAGRRQTRCHNHSSALLPTSVPPCASTRWRAIASLTPNPPLRADDARISCTNKSKMPGKASGVMRQLHLEMLQLRFRPARLHRRTDSLGNADGSRASRPPPPGPSWVDCGFVRHGADLSCVAWPCLSHTGSGSRGLRVDATPLACHDSVRYRTNSLPHTDCFVTRPLIRRWHSLTAREETRVRPRIVYLQDRAGSRGRSSACAAMSTSGAAPLLHYATGME
jgi:hypothetical protein